MSLRTPQVIVLAGITPTLTAAEVGGDNFVNSGHDFIHIKNTNAASIDVTINSQAPCSQDADHDVVVTVPATNGEKFIGPFPKSRFDDAANLVQITYSAITDVTIGIVRLP